MLSVWSGDWAQDIQLFREGSTNTVRAEKGVIVSSGKEKVTCYLCGLGPGHSAVHREFYQYSQS